MRGLADNGKYLMDQHEVRACIVSHASVHPLLIENENRIRLERGSDNLSMGRLGKEC